MARASTELGSEELKDAPELPDAVAAKDNRARCPRQIAGMRYPVPRFATG